MHLRKKYYFVDYTAKIILAKRVHKIFRDGFVKGHNEVTMTKLIKSLRWGAGVFNKQQKTTMSLDAKLFQILRSLDILIQTKLLTLDDRFQNMNSDKGFIDNFLEKETDDKLNFTFNIIAVKCKSEFDFLVTTSGFSPIKGTKQKLTDDMWNTFNSELTVAYDKTLKDLLNNKADSYTNCMDKFAASIQQEWKKSYQQTCRPPVIKNITSFENMGFTTLFDSAYERFEFTDIMCDSFIEDRTVGTCGFSKKQNNPRRKNDYYMKSDESRAWSDSETDRGHFLAHAMGGSILTNIFPQKRSTNRGRSNDGIKYRQMEKYLTDHPGTFCFARPIYFDFSTRPFILEFGYVTKDYKINVEHFENV